MAKKFDASLKQQIDQFSDEWGGFLCTCLRLPAGAQAEPMDADVSTVSAQADKLFRVSEPAGGFIHLELEARWAGETPDRVHLYNTLVHNRYGGPVRSVIVLLRPDANATAVTGLLVRRDESGEYLRFRYQDIRLWELPSEPLLTGPLGLLPLALLTDEAVRNFDEAVERVRDRILTEAPTPKAATELTTATAILMSMRYDEGQITRLIHGVPGMEDNVFVQMLMRKGRDAGRTEEARSILLKFGRQRFGAPSLEVESQLRAIEAIDQLERMLDRLMQAADWNDLLQTP